MHITDEVIDNAVLHLFIDLKVDAGSGVSAQRLRGEWPQTRLRDGDLIGGLKRLVFGGQLEFDDDHGDAHFILTPRGHERAVALPSGPRGGWNKFVSISLLNLVRRPKPRVASGNRRADDMRGMV